MTKTLSVCDIFICNEAEVTIKEAARLEAEYIEEWAWFEPLVMAKTHKIASPIEQVLLVSLLCIKNINAHNIDEKVEIQPQANIGKYRVDFLITCDDRSLVVECDSQQFHERTEPERRYEKARDRYLIKVGHKTYHYTGKEILDRPFHVAAEILTEVVGVEMNTDNG